MPAQPKRFDQLSRLDVIVAAVGALGLAAILTAWHIGTHGDPLAVIDDIHD